jgi:hypothetical protein
MNVCPQDSKITPCTRKGDSDRWCCGDSDSCCKSNIGVITLAQVLGAGLSSSSSSLSSVASQTPGARTIQTVTETTLPSASSTAQTRPTESALSEDTKDLGKGIIVVIVIAATAGMAGLVVGCWFVRRRLRKSRGQATDEHGPVRYKADAHQAPMIHEVGGAERKAELYSRSTLYELATEPSELDSSESRPRKK